MTVRAAGWRLDAYRIRERWADFTDAEKATLDRFEPDFEEAEEWGGVELMDVFDEARGEVTHLFALWPFGAGALVEIESGEQIAYVAQHYFDAHDDQALRTRLAAAWADACTRYPIRDLVDFRPGRDSPKPRPREVAGVGTLGEIRAMRARAAAGDTTLRERDAQALLWSLADQVFDLRSYRPIPVRRLFDLSELEREMLELLADAAEGPAELWHLGLPDSSGLVYRRHNSALGPSDLDRFLGRVEPTPIDATLHVDGRAHPIWCLLHDALCGVREVAAVLETIDALPLARRVAILRAVLTDPSRRLHRVVPTTQKEARKERPAEETRREQQARRQAIVQHLFDGAGEDGVAMTKALVAEHGDWAAKHGAALAKNPMLSTPDWELLCEVFSMLARHAAAQGAALDPAYDETLSALALPWYTVEPMIPVLELLPLERAGKIAVAHHALIQRFPTEDGAAALAALMARVQGPFMEKLFLDAVRALGELARPHLERARAVMPDHAAILDAALALGLPRQS